MNFNVPTNLHIDRSRVDNLLYGNIEEIEDEYDIVIDSEYQRIIDEVMSIEPYFEDYMFHDDIRQAWEGLRNAAQNVNMVDVLSLDSCVRNECIEKLREVESALDDLVWAMIELTVEVMVDAGDFDE